MKYLPAAVLVLALAAPAAAQDEGQISNPTVRFFEAGYATPRQKLRVYGTQFDRSKARFIWTELAGTNLLYRKRAQAFPLVFRYLNPDGSLFHTTESTMELPADWGGFFTTKGAGFSRKGRWTGGAYRVEVLMGGKKLCEGAFTVVDDVANRPPVAATPGENVKIAVQRNSIDDIEGAYLFCAHALGQDARFAEAYETRASFHLDQGRVAEALADAAKAIEHGPDRAEARHLRALALARSGKPEEAIKDYGRAIELNPAKAVYLRNRALARKALEDYERSLADLERCLQLDPAYAIAWNDRGLLRQRVGDFAGALEDFNRSLKADPNHSFALNNRGGLHMKRGARYQARLDFEAAIAWGSDAVRASAAESLGELGLTDATETLAGLLWDDNPGVRRAAVESVGRLKARLHAPEVARLLGDPAASVRRTAATALAEVDGRDHVEALEALLGDADPIARVHALISLCRFKVARHAPAAAELLTHEDNHLRGDAVEALGFLGDPLHAPAIAKLLTDPEADIRVKAVAALGRIGARDHAAGIAALLDDPAMGSLYDEGQAKWKNFIVSDVAARTLREWEMDPEALRPRSASAAPRPIAGTYGLVAENDPAAKSLGEFKVGPVREDGKFEIEGKDWKGRGVTGGDRGHYDWQFLDGTKGRTTFTVDAEARLHGRVVGDDLDWKYLATRK